MRALISAAAVALLGTALTASAFAFNAADCPPKGEPPATGWTAKPQIFVDIPDTAKVGSLIKIEGCALSIDPGLRLINDPLIDSFFVQVEIVRPAANGKGKGRADMIFEDIANHEHIDIDIPIRTSGWSSGAISICIRACTIDVSGDVVETVLEKEIQVVKGNGTQK